MNNENIEDGNRPDQPIDGFLEKIKNSFLDEYEPVQEYEPGVELKSTCEIYSKFHALYPNTDVFSVQDIALFLEEKGFRFVNLGNMKYEWLLKPAS